MNIPNTPAQAMNDMPHDDKIDLRPYPLVLLQHWRRILILAILVAAAAGSVSALLPRSYVATASILFHPTHSQLVFDERSITNDTFDFALYQQGLLALAKSEAVAAQIPVEIRSKLISSNYVLGDLIKRINVETEGNLFIIAAEAPTASQAQALADIWATTYISFVNDMYASRSASLEEFEQRVDEARERYAVAQQAYEEVLAANRIEELTQATNAITRTLEEARNTDLARYTAYLDRAQELDLVLRDATALRAEINAEKSAGLGESLVLLALRARANGGTELPVQLQLDQPDVITQNNRATRAGLDALIRQLETEIGSLHATAAQLDTALSNEGSIRESALPANKRAALLAQLRKLQQQKEVEASKQRILQQERDVALEALEIVQRKMAEQQVAESGTEAQVRLASKALLPTHPSSPHIIRNTLAGGLAGLCLGLMLTLIGHMIRSSPALSELRESNKRAVEQASTG